MKIDLVNYCKNGHKRTPLNTYFYKKLGNKQCITCRRMYDRRRRASRRDSYNAYSRIPIVRKKSAFRRLARRIMVSHLIKNQISPSCVDCGLKGFIENTQGSYFRIRNLQVCHNDQNWSNNSIENLSTRCIDCHLIFDKGKERFKHPSLPKP